MKARYLSLLFIVLLAIFIGLTSIKDDTPLLIVTSPKIYSFYQSSEHESVRIQLLTNKKDSYYFNEDYILDIEIFGEDNISLPLEVKSIKTTTNELKLEEDTYYEITFDLVIPFIMDDEVISIKDAILKLSYGADESLELAIGEFNYMFGSEENPFLTLGNLYTTHEKIEMIDTVGSIILELGNISNKTVTITSVEMLSQSAIINTKYVTPILDLPNSDDHVTDILERTYDFNQYQERPIRIDVQPSSQVTLLLPVSYVNSVKHIERFSIVVSYMDFDQEYKMIIDDFPFIIRSPFDLQYQDTWIYYDFSS